VRGGVAAARDELPAAGKDVAQFGSSWYLVSAGGKPMEPESSGSNSGSNTGSNSGSNTGTTGNGGGYG
jgi:hypothetical protein